MFFPQNVHTAFQANHQFDELLLNLKWVKLEKPCGFIEAFILKDVHALYFSANVMETKSKMKHYKCDVLMFSMHITMKSVYFSSFHRLPVWS